MKELEDGACCYGASKENEQQAVSGLHSRRVPSTVHMRALQSSLSEPRRADIQGMKEGYRPPLHCVQLLVYATCYAN